MTVTDQPRRKLTLKRPPHYSAEEWSAIKEHPTTAYAVDVCKERIVTGAPVRWACERHIADLQDPTYFFDLAEARRVAKFLEGLRHHEGEWDSKTLVLQPWQHFVVGSMYGWQEWSADRDRYVRRFRYAYVQIARKNGKTFLGSGLALYALTADRERGAKVYAVATKKDQAKLAWEGAKQIKMITPFLKEKVIDRVTRLIHRPSGSYFTFLGRDSKTEDGLNPHFTLVDETHAHKDGDMVNVMRSALGARAQPIILMITTAGLLGGYGRTQYDYHRAIVNPAEDVDHPRTFVYIAEIDGWDQRTGREHLGGDVDEEILENSDDPFEDEECWIKANPNLGVSVSIDSIRDDMLTAQHDESTLFETLTKRMNVWLSGTSTWMSKAIYDSNVGSVPWQNLEDVIEAERRYAFLGIDLAKSDDLSAVALVVPPEVDVLGHPTKPGYVRCWGFCPEADIEPRTKAGIPYQAFVDAGALITTPQPVTDYHAIARKVREIVVKMHVYECGYDPFFANQLALDLVGEGLDMVEVPQNHRTMTAPIEELKRLLKAGALHHGGCPLLAWSFANIMINRDPNGNVKFDKRAAREKIDPWVAVANAMQRAINYEGPPMSATEKRGGAIELV